MLPALISKETSAWMPSSPLAKVKVPPLMVMEPLECKESSVVFRANVPPLIRSELVPLTPFTELSSLSGTLLPPPVVMFNVPELISTCPSALMPSPSAKMVTLL